jgi:hypothetical protein
VDFTNSKKFPGNKEKIIYYLINDPKKISADVLKIMNAI